MYSVWFDSMSPEGGENVVIFQGSDALREDEVSNGKAEMSAGAPRLRMRGGRDHTPVSSRLRFPQSGPQERGQTRLRIGGCPVPDMGQAKRTLGQGFLFPLTHALGQELD